MKQGKKLNRKMKAFLEDKGLNPSNYLVERKTSKQVIYFECDWGKV